VIVVDTSALVAIFLRQPGFERLLRRLSESPSALLPVSCYIEFALLHRIGNHRMGWINELLGRTPLSLTPHTPEHASLAATAAMIYGKGSGHPAQLDFGDCMVYAVAKGLDLPLLFMGNDFSLTDLATALPRN
jgi:ribonuclease VapC